MLDSVMTTKGQLVVPVKLRRKYGIKPGTRVQFIEKGDGILFQPVTKNLVKSLYGILANKGSGTKELLEERARDR